MINARIGDTVTFQIGRHVNTGTVRMVNPAHSVLVEIGGYEDQTVYEVVYVDEIVSVSVA